MSIVHYNCPECEVDWPLYQKAWEEACPVCGGSTLMATGPETALSYQEVNGLIYRLKAQRSKPPVPEPEVAHDPEPETASKYTPQQLYRILQEAKAVLKALPVAHRWAIPFEERCAEYDPDAGAAYDG